MPQYKKTKMCKECPFRAKAPKGWLGPWDATDIKNMVHGESSFICHTEINSMAGKGCGEKEISEKGNHCVGFLRYRNKVCKTSKDPSQRAHQHKLREIDDQEVIPAFQFVDHHEGACHG
jgi:hypothetical protein